MNSSDFKTQIYSYLGFRGVNASAEIDGVIESCLKELDGIAQFNYTYKFFESPPNFLKTQGYVEFLKGTKGVFLSVTTLGMEIDRRIKQLFRTDMSRAVVLDACASALLEYRSDEYEKGLGENLSYRFCPGYGGTSVDDLREIFALLRPERIGVTLNENNYMLPSKSMAGIIGVGNNARKTCDGCFMLPHCKFREEGRRCYVSENR